MAIKWFDAADAADYLGLHVDSVRRLCRQNQIQYRKLKGYRFKKVWLDAFLNSRTRHQVTYPDAMKVRTGRPLDAERGVADAGDAIDRALRKPT